MIVFREHGVETYMKKILSAAFLLILFALQSAEYFVSPDGKDTADGKSVKTAFKTIGRGMALLKAGDTLTILPGTYHEAVKKRFDGDPARKTLIRAQIPGTVLIHGDLPLKDFRLHDREKGIYVTECAAEPEAVFERDTFKLYERQNSNFLLHPLPGAASYYYDGKKKLLYVRTSDAQAPEKHLLAKSLFASDGIALLPGKSKKVTNVEIDGLTVRGFMTQKVGFFFASWGIVINNARNCLIKRCTALLNCGGISMNNADSSRIERCTALGNGTLRQVSGGNIIIWSGKDSVIDRCFSSFSRTYGIRFYGSNLRTVISRSVSIEDARGAIWIKPSSPVCKGVEIFTPDWAAIRNSEHSVFDVNDYDRKGVRGKTSLALGRTPVQSYSDSFADVTKFDFRLTKNSRFKQGFKGQNFCYLSPDGSDKHDGLSQSFPRRSLEKLPAGTTVYLLPGIYTQDITVSQDNITLAGFGQSAPAVLKGKVTVTGNDATLQKLNFISSGVAVSASGKGLTVENCGFSRATVAVSSAEGAMIRHCAFAGDVKKVTSRPGAVITMSILNQIPEKAILFGNAYPEQVPQGDMAGVSLKANFTNAAAGDFSLKNEHLFKGTAVDGTLIGPAFYLYGSVDNSYFNMKLLTVSSTMATLQFEANAPLKSSAVLLRERKGNIKNFGDHIKGSTLSFVTLDKLKPATEYECFAVSSKKYGYTPGNRYMPLKTSYKKFEKNRSPLIRFKTPAADTEPGELHVSINGDDKNPGTPQKPLRTITAAALKTVPGSKVIVHGGVYQESVLIPVSGAPGKIITYCAAPGETVWLDGNDRQYCRGFAGFGKSYLHIDGFRLRMFGTALINASGIYNFFNCRHIRVTRSFYDGRSPGYSPAMFHVRFSKDISMKNCVAVNCMSSIAVIDSEQILIENSVLKTTNIWPVSYFGNQKNALRFERNIVTDNLRAKTAEPLLKMTSLENIIEADNLYFARLPRSLRAVAGLHNNKKWTLDEYYRLRGKRGRSLFGNPNFPAAPRQLCWKDHTERQRDMKKGMAFGAKVNNFEFGRNPQNRKEFLPWDFRDFFARPTRKSADGKIIGLEPEAFKGFSYAADTEGKWRTF